MDRVENEIKVLVDGEAAFETLGRLLPGPVTALPEPVAQTNRFYDTGDGALRAGGFALRLREQAGRWILTAKGPTRRQRSGDGLMSKAEVEIEIDPADGRRVCDGTASPLDLFEAGVPERPALLGAIRAAAGTSPLAQVGVFGNERRSLGAVAFETAAGPARALVEMDRSVFPGGRVDHEIEVEVLDGSPEAVLAAVRDLFERAGLAWRPAPSKARRLFAALGQRPG